MDTDEYRRMAESGERHWWYRSTRLLLRELIEPHLDLNSVNRYLDAAGGTGATGGWLTTLAPTTLAVLADYDAFALEVARTDHPDYRPVRADLNALPFADGSFSTVLCVTALCHRMNPDPGALVRDLARVAGAGAVVALMEPGGKRLWRGHDDVTHTGRRFSVRELRTMASAAGLDIITATGAYTFLVPPAFVMGLLERRRAKSDVGRNRSGLGGILGMLATAERRVLRRFELPFGLSVIVIARKPA
ncbi:MAG: methyltransferase domain-containing protein [Ilumatobacteraceae bacterium]